MLATCRKLFYFSWLLHAYHYPTCERVPAHVRDTFMNFLGISKCNFCMLVTCRKYIQISDVSFSSTMVSHAPTPQPPHLLTLFLSLQRDNLSKETSDSKLLRFFGPMRPLTLRLYWDICGKSLRLRNCDCQSLAICGCNCLRPPRRADMVRLGSLQQGFPRGTWVQAEILSKSGKKKELECLGHFWAKCSGPLGGVQKVCAKEFVLILRPLVRNPLAGVGVGVS